MNLRERNLLYCEPSEASSWGRRVLWAWKTLSLKAFCIDPRILCPPMLPAAPSKAAKSRRKNFHRVFLSILLSALDQWESTFFVLVGVRVGIWTNWDIFYFTWMGGAMNTKYFNELSTIIANIFQLQRIIYSALIS